MKKTTTKTINTTKTKVIGTIHGKQSPDNKLIGSKTVAELNLETCIIRGNKHHTGSVYVEIPKNTNKIGITKDIDNNLTQSQDIYEFKGNYYNYYYYDSKNPNKKITKKIKVLDYTGTLSKLTTTIIETPNT